jgi:signal transduction histidine kinase
MTPRFVERAPVPGRRADGRDHSPPSRGVFYHVGKRRCNAGARGGSPDRQWTADADAISCTVRPNSSEQERERLEAQLRQWQKMEAVGQLAGGIAHDFNTVLFTILGNAELASSAMRKAPGDNQVADELDQIEQAARQAADLTRRLLTFSRRQVAPPEVLNLNEVIANLRKMLHRLLTEDIALEVMLAPGLRTVRVDRVQMDRCW